jgi:hypothetical protein
MYKEKFDGLFNEILTHKFKENFVLRDCIPYIDDEYTFSKEVISLISQIPPKKWAIDFERAMEQNGINCSCATALAGLILERKNVEVEYGNPPGHALLVIKLNSSKYYVDPHSDKGVFERIEDDNLEIEKFNSSFKVYKIKGLKGRMGYKLIPTLKLEDGIMYSYLNNLLVENKLSTQKSKEIEDTLRSNVTFRKMRQYGSSEAIRKEQARIQASKNNLSYLYIKQNKGI